VDSLVQKASDAGERGEPEAGAEAAGDSRWVDMGPEVGCMGVG
jgi:hypothetical protein